MALAPPARRHAGKALAVLLFLLWEGWWAYEFAAAPRPDYEMRSVFAFLLGGVLPLLVAFAAGLALLLRRARRVARHSGAHARR